MTNTLPIVFKAYSAKGQLIVSKPINPLDYSRIIDIYQDMFYLGVMQYWIKQGRESKHYLIKQDRNARFKSLRLVHSGSNL